MTGQQVYRQDLPDAREHQLQDSGRAVVVGVCIPLYYRTEGIQTQWVQVQH